MPRPNALSKMPPPIASLYTTRRHDLPNFCTPLHSSPFYYARPLLAAAAATTAALFFAHFTSSSSTPPDYFDPTVDGPSSLSLFVCCCKWCARFVPIRLYLNPLPPPFSPLVPYDLFFFCSLARSYYELGSFFFLDVLSFLSSRSQSYRRAIKHYITLRILISLLPSNQPTNQPPPPIVSILETLSSLN
jgi:hypothetical protein